ncbi:MAG: hypothetical protein N4R17_06480, partial [Lactobacillus iners]|nr:hypothetical protein [Lactobacillus iners]
AFQLIDDNITVLYPGQHFKDLKEMDKDAVFEKYHVTPKQYPDLAALRGETADNIPGVPGVGDGYAAKWINQFGSLENIIEHSNEISGKKGEALRKNIDQVRLNRKVNALVCDLDLGVTVDDLCFGDVDAAKLGILLSQLEFGELKKRKILKTFSNGTQQSIENNMRIMFSSTYEGNANNDELVQGDQSNIDAENFQEMLASIDLHHVKTVEDFINWENSVSSLLYTEIKKDSKNTEDTFDQLSSEEENFEELSSEKIINNSRKCAEPILKNQEVVIYAHECKKNSKHHFELTADSLIILVAHKAVLLYASDLQSADRALLEMLRKFLQKNSSITVLHDYKKHLGLLKSLKLFDSNNSFGTPLLDTRLASYLLEPDFRAETLENMAEHYLDIQSDEDNLGENEAKQGELDLLIDDETPASEEENNEKQTQAREAKFLRTALLIRLLALHFASTLDDRKQTGLMTDLEMPISRVLRGMEDVGAAVDMQRLSGMLKQFSADAEFAQNMAWKVAGSSVN